jgi:hypothetical protein
MSADVFDNLDALRLTPEMVVKTKPKRDGQVQRRKHLVGNFYMVPEAWFDEVCKVVGSKEQLVVALRLYQLWRSRKPGADYVVASNSKLRSLPDTKRRALVSLQKAGLIKMQGGGNGKAPRVEVLG